MNELLRQALWFTAIGMGMTFLSIGALVVGMYLLTALFPEKKRQTEAAPDAEINEALPEDHRYLAAAAAVAVAVAQTQRAQATPAKAPSQWRTYARNYHIAQCSRHNQKRYRVRH